MKRLEEHPEIELGEILRAKGKTIATAESCTGGNIAHRLTQWPGSSDFFLGGIVSYANEVKINVLQVEASAIEQFGAVSQLVVEQMAKGAVKVIGADYAVATSGVAGPGGGSPEKPVGTVWMAVSNGEETESRCYHFGTERSANIEDATKNAIFFIKEFVTK
ncbi:MAG: CinA family protein [Paludibacteraceae bacterium]|nr:CinA family protein [Paludibacteraceae bacterium]